MRALYIVAVYLGLMAVYIYWVVERQLFYANETANWLLPAVLGSLHVILGLLLVRWWALALPLLAVVLAVPAGYPDANKGEPLPIPVGLALFSPLAILLVALGVAVAMASRRRAVRSS